MTKQIREGISRKEFLKLSIKERRKILEEQANQLLKDCPEYPLTKQERLQESIAFKLFEFDGGTKECWDIEPKERKEYRYRALLLRQHLHSQGAVLKVERKLPLISEADVKEWNEATIDGIKTCQRFMVKAGYVATKPLIDGLSSPPTFRDGSALAFAEPLVCCPSCKKLPCRCPLIGSLYVEEG